MEAIWGHRADMAADLTPAEAQKKKDEDGGQGLEAHESGHEFVGAVKLLLEFAEAEVRRAKSGTQEREHFCWGFGRMVEDNGVRVSEGVGGRSRPGCHWIVQPVGQSITLLAEWTHRRTHRRVPQRGRETNQVKV